MSDSKLYQGEELVRAVFCACSFAAPEEVVPTICESVKAVIQQKDAAYKERNALVALLSKVFPAWLERHPEDDKDWEDDWRWIVFIELPTGQCSWHIHDSEYPAFAEYLNEKKGPSWDAHTTEEKYKRIANYTPMDECYFCGLRVNSPGHIVDGRLTCNQ